MERGPADVYRRYERLFPLCTPDDVDDGMSAVAIATHITTAALREPVVDADAFQYRIMSRFLLRVTKQKRRFVHPDASDDGRGWDMIEESPHAVAMHTPAHEVDDRLETEAILDHLPDHYAQVLQLHYLQGFTLEEAAQHIGVSGPCMRKRHERALKVARRLMGISHGKDEEQGGNDKDAIAK